MKPDYTVSLNHTGLVVTDLDETIRFFTDCLGFDLQVRQPVPKAINRLLGISGLEVEQAFLIKDSSRIELLCYQSPPDREVISSRAIDTGATHLGVYVNDAKASVAKAQEFGFELMGEFVEIENTGQANPITAVAWLRNSDGLTVEFLEVPKN